MDDSPQGDVGGSGAGWWRVSLRSKGVAVLAVPLAALFVALFSVYLVEGNIRDADRTVGRAFDTRSQLVELRTSLLDAESAISAYLATGDARFTARYEKSRSSMNRALDNTAALVADEPDGLTRFRTIKELAREDVRLLDELRAFSPKSVGAESLMEREKAAMSNLQAQVALLSEHHELLFMQARDQRDLARRRLVLTIVWCGILGPLGALFIHLLLAGRMVRRLHTVEENARRLAHGLPLEPMPHGSDEISALGKQLEDAAYLLREREREFRASERRYRELFDQAPIPYEELDGEGTVRHFNQAVCQLLKCSPKEMLGRSAWEFLSPERQEAAHEALLEHIRTGYDLAPFECDYVLNDGSHLTVEIRENLIHNNNGQTTGVIRSLLDVTERNLAAKVARKLEQYAAELRKKNEQLGRALEAARSATIAKSRFLASVSHELRTPLNGIIGFSELLFDGKLGNIGEDQKDVLGDILMSSRHLLQLINEILDLSKVEAGRMEFHPEPSHLRALALEVRDVVRPLVEKKGLRLEVEVQEGLTANLDPARFKQVLFNYLSNAVKFTGEGGSVKLRVVAEGSAWLRVEVEDTGIGIATDEIARLFQEFAQLPNSRKAQQGTGLGLALTRQIVEAQGGSVAVRSDLGKGSIFSALLPTG